MSYKRKGYQRDDVAKRRTRVVSTRVDDVTLAKLLMAFDQREIEVSSLSELVYLACLSLASIASVPQVEPTLDEARVMLSERFRIPVDPPGQNKSAFYKHLHVAEAFKSDGKVRDLAFPPLNARRPKDYINQRVLERDDEIPVEQVLEIQQQVMERLKREKAEKEELMRLATEGSMTQANGSIKKDKD
jgi:hypothetical protein